MFIKFSLIKLTGHLKEADLSYEDSLRLSLVTIVQLFKVDDVVHELGMLLAGLSATKSVHAGKLVRQEQMREDFPADSPRGAQQESDFG